jgi:hypothetical protein
MAVNDTMNAPRRRLVFGVNVIVQAILALAVVVAVIWITGLFNLQADLTGTGRNSLSPRTVQLLKHLDQNVRITAVFPEPDKRDQIGQKRRQAMRDLLDLYEQAGGGRVTTAMLDPSLEKAATDKLLKRLTELPAYKDEARPHQEALAASAKLTEDLKNLATDESKRLEELAHNDPQAARNRNFAIVRNNLRQVARDVQETQQKIKELTEGEIPRYGQAIKEVRDSVKNGELTLRDTSTWMTTEGASIAGITPDLQTFFQGAPARYEAVLKDMQELLKKTENLKDVKVEELYTGLTRWRSGPPVLVESEHEARVVPFWDLWVPPSEPGAPISPDGDDRVFAGESAISSNILQLTQKDKTGVVFVRYGGQPLLRPDYSQMQNPMMMQQMPRAPYQELNSLLDKAGFVTQEWDVATQKTPPKVEKAARTVYVVLPPEPSEQPDPRRPQPKPGMTPDDRKAVLDAVGASGMAVFMAGFMPPTAPYPGAAGTYEYADYLKSKWGVDVAYNELALHFMPHPEGRKDQWVPARQPQLLSTDDVVRLTDHPISAPLAADRAGFILAAPLRILPAESRPAGEKIDVVAEVRKTSDAWASSDLASLEQQFKRTQSVRPGPTDSPAPFPIAVAASRETGGEGATTAPVKSERIVVISSEHFAEDQLAQQSGFQMRGNALVVGPLYPANTDLFINALHWLTGEADRISVGPRTGDVPRLTKLTEAWSARLPWLLVGVWPALALVAGFGVWLVRRK